MDGTLVDSERYWMAAEAELVTEYGGEWTTEDGIDMVGRALEYSAVSIQNHGVPLSIEEIVVRLSGRVRELMHREVPWRPGSKELLFALRAAGVPTALVTMSRRATADIVLDSIGELAFDAIVTAELVRPKPLPDAYLHAAELLGVAAADCVAIEDSETGLRSATSAGAVVIAVPLHAPVPPELGHVTWPDGALGRGVHDVAEVFHRHRTGGAA